MKQKNIILMVVAVGCGLVAALLTSQMSAKPKTETVDVIVAQKDLPVGTMITKEDLPKIIKFRKIPKDALPPVYVQAEEDMVGKRLGRSVRLDETFNPADLKTGGNVTIPKGMDMMAITVGLPEAVAGFVTPGSKVDVLATTNVGQRKLAFPLLVNMLVLAVDASTELPKDAPSYAALNTVSFAVDRDQALLLHLAKARGCQLSLVLRNTANEQEKEGKEQWKPDDVRRLLQNPDNASEWEPGRPVVMKDDVDLNKEKPKAVKSEEMVDLPIARTDLPAGTELTIDIIKEKFEFKKVPAPAPPSAVLNIEEMAGKYLQNALAADQWLPKTFVADSQPGKTTPKDHFVPEMKVPEPDKSEPKVAVGPGAKKTHDVTVSSGSGHRIFRFEEKKPGSNEWLLVGEVTKNPESSQEWKPAPVPEPIPEPKSEPVPQARQD